jgi:signal transduction histidine kinase
LNKRFGNQQGEEGLSQFIIDEVVRLSRVLTDFLMFARPPMPTMESVTAQELIHTIIPYVKQSDKYTVDCQIPDELPSLYIDLELCKQAFLNLILNAQDAMPDGGTISIKFRAVRMDEILIEVVDEGSGVPDEIIDRIFDPFVTSKDTGTGLGLSLVHQILSNQNGKIEVESNKDQGTCFRIFLPACQESPAPLEHPVVNTV